MSEEEEIRESVDRVKSRGTFSIIDVLSERSYPETSVSVSIDESSAYQAAIVKEELEALINSVNGKATTAKQKSEISDLEDKIEELTVKLNKSKYTFNLMGISEGKREELWRDACKKYPVEYEKNDISALLGTAANKAEKPSPERDSLFTDYLWLACIRSIEDPDGNLQESLAYNDVKSMRNSLPLSAIAKINEAVEKLRTATAVFMMETGEDFLAKP